MPVLAAASPLAGAVVIALAALAVDIVAVVRVARSPRSSYRFGWWSKAAWILVALSFTWSLGNLPVPVGGIVVLARTRRRPPSPDSPGGIPAADGEWTPGQDDQQ
jgi:hypothetical protein